nr:putative effector protein 1 [Sporisorium scitamineum]
MIELTTAFVAAAAVLSTAAQAQLQCSLSTIDSNIISVDAFSASDLASRFARPDDKPNWADVLLTEEYQSDVWDADRYIVMRHNGEDCRKVGKAKYHICNADYVEEETGNSCAQVISKSHSGFSNKGKSLVIPASPPQSPGSTDPAFMGVTPNTPVHFRVSLSSSLSYWWAGITETCANQIFNADDKPMKYLTFTADNMHTWKTVSVILDQPDINFDDSWRCNHDPNMSAKKPYGFTYDNGKSWTFSNVAFEPILYQAALK